MFPKFAVRKDELDTGLEEALEEAVREWVSSEWPFGNVLYPGRDVSWEEVESLPDKGG